MRVLGIETSCDDTGVAIYDTQRGLLAHLLHSQIALHNEYGGVVPELASRNHTLKVLPLIEAVLEAANLSKHELEGIAYTQGPGLLGALLVGATIGQSLAMGLNIPCIGVHHMEGHLLAPMLDANPPDFPFVALLVSGGHTQLVKVEAFGRYQLLGESLDDAAGEAFDKTAKLMGLPYPGGPAIAQLAEKGVSGSFNFPRPMTDRPGLEFSFSGLKTAVAQAYENSDKSLHTQSNIAHAFQTAIIETLLIKCLRALEYTRLNRLVIAGGVSANRLLRDRLWQVSKEKNFEFYTPALEFCTDNGAMIAYVGAQRLLAGEQSPLEVTVKPRWGLEELKKLKTN